MGRHCRRGGGVQWVPGGSPLARQSPPPVLLSGGRGEAAGVHVGNAGERQRAHHDHGKYVALLKD